MERPRNAQNVRPFAMLSTCSRTRELPGGAAVSWTDSILSDRHFGSSLSGPIRIREMKRLGAQHIRWCELCSPLLWTACSTDANNLPGFRRRTALSWEGVRSCPAPLRRSLSSNTTQAADLSLAKSRQGGVIQIHSIDVDLTLGGGKVIP